MFGGNYHREESKPLAELGEQEVILGIPTFKQKGVYKWLEFPITYAKGGEMSPDSFALFDVQNPSDPKEQSDFNKQATKIFDCFDIEPSFDDKRFPLWKGKRGIVILARDKKGFVKVVGFKMSEVVKARRAQQGTLDEAGGYTG